MISIIYIIGGLMAASSLIISKKPDAQDIFNKIVPYQGWIGLFLTFFGLYHSIVAIVNLKLMQLPTAAICFVVGFLLGYPLISKYILEKNDEAKEKGRELRGKLIKYQIPAGVILTILGVLNLLSIN